MGLSVPEEVRTQPVPSSSGIQLLRAGSKTETESCPFVFDSTVKAKLHPGKSKVDITKGYDNNYSDFLNRINKLF